MDSFLLVGIIGRIFFMGKLCRLVSFIGKPALANALKDEELFQNDFPGKLRGGDLSG